jgi:hypothetical protein
VGVIVDLFFWEFNNQKFSENSFNRAKIPPGIINKSNFQVNSPLSNPSFSIIYHEAEFNLSPTGYRNFFPFSDGKFT